LLCQRAVEWCSNEGRLMLQWTRRRSNTTELSNLELEGGRHVPGLLSHGVGCSGTVTGGLGSGVEGSQGINRESRNLPRGGSTHGSRLLGCGELLLRHVLGVDGAPVSGGGRPDGGGGRGIEVGSLGGKRDGVLRGGLGRLGSGRGAAARGRAGEQQLGEEGWRRRIEATGGGSVTRGGSSRMVAEERTVPMTVVPGGLGEEKEGRSAGESGRRSAATPWQR
jgi:hypothetical protein